MRRAGGQNLAAFSGSIAGTNNGVFEDCYYLELSAKAAQTDGHNAVGTHTGRAAILQRFIEKYE